MYSSILLLLVVAVDKLTRFGGVAGAWKVIPDRWIAVPISKKGVKSSGFLQSANKLTSAIKLGQGDAGVEGSWSNQRSYRVFDQTKEVETSLIKPRNFYQILGTL